MRLRELNESHSIVVVNTKLNPKIWIDNDLMPEVADKLKQIAQAFQEFVAIDLDVVDLTITGSNANYTWTDFSDLDLHVIISNAPTTEQRELFNAKKALWAEQHTITVKGLPVECYVQGQDEPHHSTGVYSLLSRDWIVKPKKVKPQVDDAAVEAKKDGMLSEIEAALLSRDLDKIRTVKDRVVKMRKAGLTRAGEWSVENLVFKILRNLGLIDQLADKIRELEDQELSLEQQVPPLD